MDVRTLRYFLIVAEEGSVHAGARRALISQPALSTALRNLEREFGTSLFERSYRGVELTPAGSALLAHVRKLLRTMDETKGAVKAGLVRGQRTFTVGLVEGRVSAGELTGPILAAFQEGHPHLRLLIQRLNFVDQFNAVLDGTVDVAIVRAPYEHDDLALAPLFSEPTILVASPDHPIAELTEVPVESILNETVLEVVRPPAQWRDFWNFSQLRTEETRRIQTDAVDLLQFSMDLLVNSTMSPMGLSGWRLGGLYEPSLRGIRVQDGPQSIAGVGYRRADTRTDVQSFVRIATDVCSAMISLVPDSELIATDEANPAKS